MKWDKNADMGILLGYSEVGYRVLLNNRIIVSGHVDIVEKDVKCIGIDYNDDEKESDCSTDDEVSDNAFEVQMKLMSKNLILKRIIQYLYIILRENVKMIKIKN